MAKGNNQKLKLLYMIDIFEKYTDDNHGITTNEIINYLDEYNINAERKTIYQDMEELRQYGIDIIKNKEGRNTYYHLAYRLFELPELKLLVDCVQSAKFVTERKSNELIKKLESMASKYEAKELQRQVVINGRVKTMNESIYYNVDKIHNAINSNLRINFQYFQWNTKKQMSLRHDGAIYEVSPLTLIWNDENYYLVGFDSKDQIIKHYRVDKMLHIELSNKPREGLKEFNKINIAKYSKSMFGMYSADEYDVTLRCKNEYVGIIIDRFGKDIMIIPDGKEYFKTHVHVYGSKQFIAWIIALGDNVKILEPTEMIKAIKDEAKRIAKQYK